MASQVGCYGKEAFVILNGEYHSLSKVPVDISLNSFIRDYAHLKGTKFMCREGGCGICVVSLRFTHPATGEEKTISVNSCMFPAYACHGLEVTTVEGVGSKQKGYHEIQTRLTHFYGSQCGYCTPGWVMSMYRSDRRLSVLLESNPKATMEEIENSFSGNLCRCTGYRPILDAFKSFASDRTQDLEQKVLDIEDLVKGSPHRNSSFSKLEKGKPKKLLKNAKEKEREEQSPTDDSKSLRQSATKLSLTGEIQWYHTENVDEIFEIFMGMVDGCSYMLLGGNTAQGVIKGQPSPDVFIDVNSVPFLKSHSFYSGSWYVGANTTLSEAIVLFKAVAEENPKYFSYLQQLAHHIEKVANTPVRNVGTLAGNLTIKHQKRSFQSDIFLILEAVGALLSVRSECESISVLSLPEYLESNMYKKLILQIIFPPLDNCFYVFKSYKIAPRAQNAIALVHGAFLFNVDKRNGFCVREKPRIVYGNINPHFVPDPSCDSGAETRTMHHIVNDCPLRALPGGIAGLHNVDDAAQNWDRELDLVL